MATKINELKRYTLVLPHELYDEVKRIADVRHISVVELFRKFIRLGILAMKLEDDPESALIIREGDKEQVVKLI
ncbi:MAG: hypothetical protein KDE53_07735 [Caldilineaceae bacterium]|nr:hypothetical protein [Caldilineaceae bacterium]